MKNEKYFHIVLIIRSFISKLYRVILFSIENFYYDSLVGEVVISYRVAYNSGFLYLKEVL